MAADKQTVGLKLTPELAANFKELQGEAGSAQEFVEILLAAYAERQEEIDTASPIYKEQVKVKQALASVERVVSAYLELAANDKIQAQVTADEKIAIAQEKVTELKNHLSANKEEIMDLQTGRADLKKQVEALESQIESLDTLKASWALQEAAWAEKESGYATRIGELDIQAKETRELKGQITDLESTMVKQRQVIALAEQKAGTDATAITDLKIQVKSLKEDHKAELTAIKKELKIAEKALSAAALDCSEQISEMRAEAAKEQGKLEQQIVTLQEQLNKADKTLESVETENLKLKADLEKAFEKALDKMGDEYKKLKSEQEKTS